jgi:hypothetical protein
MRTTLTLIMVLAGAVVLSGCSLIGLGIGAAVPKYSERVDSSMLPAGTRVLVTEDIGRKTQGTLVSATNGDVTVDEGGARGRQTMRGEVRKRDGTYWASGLAAGLLVDCLLTTAAIFYVASHPMFSGGFPTSLPGGSF